jgi:t-SNARE complex subunit (syntaxin)
MFKKKISLYIISIIVIILFVGEVVYMLGRNAGGC